MRNKEIIYTIFIKGLQNFDNYNTHNPIEIKIDTNTILTNLNKHQKGDHKYRFWVSHLSFSSGIKNSANILFITCNGLKDAHDSIINESVKVNLSYTSWTNKQQEKAKRCFEVSKCNPRRFRWTVSFRPFCFWIWSGKSEQCFKFHISIVKWKRRT